MYIHLRFTFIDTDSNPFFRMPSTTINFTPEFIKSCESLWRDGYTKGVNGEDDFPDFKSFFENTKTKVKAEPSYEELEKLPFNPSKCEARVEKFGFAIQCTRSPFGGGCLCKTHQNMLDKLPQGKDIRYGRFNQPRPDVTLDKGEPIKWGPKKSRTKSDKVSPTPKLKVGELRDYLSTRIPNENFKGLKKPELLQLYEKEKMKEETSSDTDESVDTQQSVESVETPESEATPESVETPDSEATPESVETPESEAAPESVETIEDGDSEPMKPVDEDDGAGTLINQKSKYPYSKVEYIKLFESLGIETEGIVGMRNFKLKYDEFLKEKEAAEKEAAEKAAAEKIETDFKGDEDTEEMSDADDLEEDHSDFDTIDYEGVEYLEDEKSGNIYNTKYVLVGRWNDMMDGINWVDEKFKLEHEDKSS